MPHPIDIHVGAKLRAIRVSRGLSQTQLGKSVGLSFQQIQKYETAANRISASTLFMLCQKLGVEPASFFSDFDSEAAPDPLAECSTRTVRVAAMLASVPEGSVKTKLYNLIEALTVASHDADQSDTLSSSAA